MQGFKHQWTKIYEDHIGDFPDINGNKIGQMAMQAGQGDVKTKDELKIWIKKWKEKRIKQPQKVESLRDLEKKGMFGGNYNFSEYIMDSKETQDDKDTEDVLKQSIFGPPLLKTLIEDTGFWQHHISLNGKDNY